MTPPPNTGINDPSAFLAALHAATGARQPSNQDSATGEQDSSSSSTTTEQAPAEQATVQESNGASYFSVTPPDGGSVGSPHIDSGTRAPPPTPAFRATLTYNGTHIDPLPEVENLAGSSSSSSEASGQPHGTPLEPVPETSTEESVEEAQPESQAEIQPEDHIAAFVAFANKSTENLSHSKHAPKRGIPVITRTGRSDKSFSATSTRQLSPKPSSSERAPKKELSDKMKALATGTDYQESVLSKFRKEHTPEQASEKAVENMEKVQGGVSDVEEAGKSSKTVIQQPLSSTQSDVAVPLPASDESTANASGQGGQKDRQNMTYFSSWGTVAARDAPPSRVRTIVLSNLPAATNATLITSLIHGGAIETLKVTKPSDTAPASARVTFTTGDAADAYYAKYPNGVDFRFQGKKYTAFVDKGQNVDVVSGVMRGYLESGASRVVRAAGADDDWGMRALKKLAEAKGRTVEAIVDTSREEARTIVFRFTNISDAVKFKAELVRDVDWETCDIYFVEDPCVKATAVHFDN